MLIGTIVVFVLLTGVGVYLTERVDRPARLAERLAAQNSR
ncbi:hypothetical protein BH09PSE4_BH09PSE4_05690 [soil metagenome]